MIMLFLLMMNNMMMFNKDLNYFYLQQLDDSVIIVTDHLYCNDCMTTLMKLKYLWQNDYKTNFVTKSRPKIAICKDIELRFRNNFKFDSIYFVTADNYFGFSKIVVGNYTVTNSPSMIIKKGDILKEIKFETLFPKGYDSLSVKLVITNTLKNLKE